MFSLRGKAKRDRVGLKKFRKTKKGKNKQKALHDMGKSGIFGLKEALYHEKESVFVSSCGICA